MRRLSWPPHLAGDETSDYFGLPSGLFKLLFLGIPALAIANTFIFYFYFQSPKQAISDPSVGYFHYSSW